MQWYLNRLREDVSPDISVSPMGDEKILFFLTDGLVPIATLYITEGNERLRFRDEFLSSIPDKVIEKVAFVVCQLVPDVEISKG